MKWEYYETYLPSIQETNKLGGEGWELVTVDDKWYYFKRPLESKVIAPRPVGRPKK